MNKITQEFVMEKLAAFQARYVGDAPSPVKPYQGAVGSVGKLMNGRGDVRSSTGDSYTVSGKNVAVHPSITPSAPTTQYTGSSVLPSGRKVSITSNISSQADADRIAGNEQQYENYRASIAPKYSVSAQPSVARANGQSTQAPSIGSHISRSLQRSPSAKSGIDAITSRFGGGR